ncbi:MAG: NIPSNAP family protein, partial [Gammaproteobacteria bacterium]|nr:NIPSNAP family protein [Gammaproteobacteria bacterium]
VDMRSDIFEPLPFSPPMEPAKIGPYYEMRTYTLRPGGAAEMAERWQAHLPGRLALSPLAGVFTSDIGGLNQWLHIWAYESLDQRVAVRKKATAEGIWPPPGASPVVSQENKIVLPAPFSPMQ